MSHWLCDLSARRCAVWYCPEHMAVTHTHTHTIHGNTHKYEYEHADRIAFAATAGSVQLCVCVCVCVCVYMCVCVCVKVLRPLTCQRIMSLSSPHDANIEYAEHHTNPYTAFW